MKKKNFFEYFWGFDTFSGIVTLELWYQILFVEWKSTYIEEKGERQTVSFVVNIIWWRKSSLWLSLSLTLFFCSWYDQWLLFFHSFSHTSFSFGKSNSTIFFFIHYYYRCRIFDDNEFISKIKANFFFCGWKKLEKC